MTQKAAVEVRFSADELRPLPMRITQKSYTRLLALRDWDGMSVQDHIRRALDFYLNETDKSIALDQDKALQALKARGGGKPATLPIPPIGSADYDVAPRQILPTTPPVAPATAGHPPIPRHKSKPPRVGVR